MKALIDLFCIVGIVFFMLGALFAYKAKDKQEEIVCMVWIIWFYLLLKL